MAKRSRRRKNQNRLISRENRRFQKNFTLKDSTKKRVFHFSDKRLNQNKKRDKKKYLYEGINLYLDARKVYKNMTNIAKLDRLKRITRQPVSIPQINPISFIDHRINPIKLIKRELVCRARRYKRESLFALNIIGRGKGGSGKKRKMTEDSKIKC